MQIEPEPPAIVDGNRPASSWPYKGRIELQHVKVYDQFSHYSIIYAKSVSIYHRHGWIYHDSPFLLPQDLLYKYFLKYHARHPCFFLCGSYLDKVSSQRSIGPEGNHLHFQRRN